MQNYRYRVDENEGKLPEGNVPVVQASDPITVSSRSVYALRVLHVFMRDPFGVARRGFMPSIKANCLPEERGEVHFGEDGVAYGKAVGSGLLLIDKKSQEVSGLAVAVG